MATFNDLWDMERRVMEFYDALMRESRATEIPLLKGTAWQIVMSYRTIQVELVNNMAADRKITIAELALMADEVDLTRQETSLLQLMMGMFQLHRDELIKAVKQAEAEAPAEVDNFKAILESVKIETGHTAEGDDDGRS